MNKPALALAALALVAEAAPLFAQGSPSAPAAQPAPVATPTPAPSPSPTPQAPPPTATGPRGPADPAGLGTYDVLGNTGQVSSGSAFNPAVSVIPDGVYYNDNRQGAAGAQADGFGAPGAGPERGFSLREAEMAFSGAVDPYFDVWTIFAVGDGEIEIEEGYVLTRKFLPGLQLKFGKFFSGFGYVNKQHPHQWDFVDQNLPYEALLAGSLNEAGVQLTWLPNLPFYTLFGVEALQGGNEGFASQLGGESSPFFGEKPGPRLFTGFLKIAPNVGYSNALQIGATYAYSRQHQELHAGEFGADGQELPEQAFQGDAKVMGLDIVWKYDSSRQYGKGDLTVQAEYLRRVKDLDLVAVGGEPLEGAVPTKSTQDGLYAQAVYGILPRWTVGLRFDTIGLTNEVSGGGQSESFSPSRRYSANLTFNPTEFSRLRIQYARGDFAVGGARESYNQVYVQFQMSLGAHGAHKF